ncbi:hypothetical protein NSK_005427 [Nannochloropsis salina CCMP1776]|uniref:Arrestin-like N-terminal domain-containing protein n=1 Tax=Nannochloropsis salina CCMP1776 TaxID=1027361 RepID=A0A4D9D179_9STRA|nr:hypothetical protein NSK_005427 [Nannochloropsis salina CCMP1776]|eukprot:TFJ83265.1 hypothetical protein NSK_005427 [Nannochloropsis salina CCMP1776]
MPIAHAVAASAPPFSIQQTHLDDFALRKVAFTKSGISLWLPKTDFYPGETVIGKMKAKLTSKKTIRAVKAKLKSEAVASWTESSGEHSSTYYAALELAPTVELILQEGTPSGSTFVLERRREYEWVGEANLQLAVPITILPFSDGSSVTPTDFSISVGVENVSKRTLTDVRLALVGEIVLTGGQAFSTHEATRSDPFTVAEHLVASKVLPGTSLALHAVTTFPTLLMQWNPDFDIALCRSRKPKKLNIVQMPSFVAGNVFQIKYHLELTAKSACSYIPDLSVPITFVPSHPPSHSSGV